MKIEEIKKKFQVFGPPGFVFIDAEGDELKDNMFYGYLDPSDFYDTLDMIAE